MPTGAIFIDLSKAFDMIDHYLLLDKLYAIGLSTNSLLFFNNFFILEVSVSPFREVYQNLRSMIKVFHKAHP